MQFELPPLSPRISNVEASLLCRTNWIVEKWNLDRTARAVSFG